MVKGRTTTMLFLAGCLGLCLVMTAAHGDAPWRTEFDAACAHSNSAMTLSVQELKKLIEICDRLEKGIETEDETVRKVFLKRLRLCRNLYVFVLETKQREQPQK